MTSRNRRYALDTDILANLQRTGLADEIRKLGRLPVVVTDVVWDEFVDSRERKGGRPQTVAEAKDLLESIAGAPTCLRTETVEAATFAKLHGTNATEDAGEHSVIAYAVHHHDVDCVLFDRRALYRAVEEVRGRVLSLFGFLDVLRCGHGLAPVTADRIAAKLCAANVSLRRPLWW